jgi:Raf kinase inhibitor-like YbhB/YbcL family protein
MTLTSPSFGHGEAIPRNHTADGAGLSPAITWSGLPPGTKSLALVVEDPDAPDPMAPQRTFCHWIVYNIQPATTGLALGANRGALPGGVRQGLNDAGHVGYVGPAPPVGRHRYIFRLFALDTVLPAALGEVQREVLLDAMAGHILAEAELMGTYSREPDAAHPMTMV